MAKKLRRLRDVGELLSGKTVTKWETQGLVIYDEPCQSTRTEDTPTSLTSTLSTILPPLLLLLQGICGFKVGTSKPCHWITHFSKEYGALTMQDPCAVSRRVKPVLYIHNSMR